MCIIKPLLKTIWHILFSKSFSTWKIIFFWISWKFYDLRCTWKSHYSGMILLEPPCRELQNLGLSWIWYLKGNHRSNFLLKPASAIITTCLIKYILLKKIKVKRLKLVVVKFFSPSHSFSRNIKINLNSFNFFSLTKQHKSFYSQIQCTF